MKASNPKIMIAAYRLLVARLNELGPDWNYPLHLGVTEAGEGEDARIKSAIGIGSLLADGIGDTIRVSLTEDSPHEIPVAKALIENIKKTPNPPSPWTGSAVASAQRSTLNAQLSFDPFSYQRRATEMIAVVPHERDDSGQRITLGGTELIRVVVQQTAFDKIAHKIDRMGDYKPEIVYESAAIREVDPRDDSAVAKINLEDTPQLVTVRDDIDLPVIAAFRLLATKLQARHPILLKDTLNCRASVSDANRNDGVSQSGAAGARATQTGRPKGEARGSERIKRPTDFLSTLLTASTNMGSLLCDGIGDAILVQGE